MDISEQRITTTLKKEKKKRSKIKVTESKAKISNYFIQDKKISKAIAETMDDLSANQNYFLSKQTKKER